VVTGVVLGETAYLTYLKLRGRLWRRSVSFRS
jgi:hypothetical protein